MFTALLGGEVQVHTLSGDIKLNVPVETQNGTVLRLKNKGFPIYGETDKYGDLYLKIRVDLPKQLTEKEKEIVKQWKETRQS